MARLEEAHNNANGIVKKRGTFWGFRPCCMGDMCASWESVLAPQFLMARIYLQPYRYTITSLATRGIFTFTWYSPQNTATVGFCYFESNFLASWFPDEHLHLDSELSKL